MSLFRPDRQRRGPDRFLAHKMLLFAIGAGFALAGLASGSRWLINIGIIVLALGAVLRFARGRNDDADGPS